MVYSDKNSLEQEFDLSKSEEQEAARLPKSKENLGSKTDSKESCDTAEINLSDNKTLELKKERDYFKDLAQRAQADLVNFRRRVATDRDKERKRDLIGFILPILDVTDYFEHAIAAFEHSELDSNSGSSWFNGIKAVYKKMLDTLSSLDVKRVETINQKFDPSMHEAVATLETKEKEADIVVAQIRPGYKYQEEVIRPAQVKITVQNN